MLGAVKGDGASRRRPAVSRAGAAVEVACAGQARTAAFASMSPADEQPKIDRAAWIVKTQPEPGFVRPKIEPAEAAESGIRGSG